MEMAIRAWREAKGAKGGCHARWIRQDAFLYTMRALKYPYGAHARHMSMIPKSGHRFSEKIMLRQ
jgi:hypothetical protein